MARGRPKRSKQKEETNVSAGIIILGAVAIGAGAIIGAALLGVAGRKALEVLPWSK